MSVMIMKKMMSRNTTSIIGVMFISRSFSLFLLDFFTGAVGGAGALAASGPGAG
jgi:hypothetical protein